jgi:hypothetical protein
MDLKISINKMPLNSKKMPDEAIEKHVSLELLAKASEYSDLIDMSLENIKSFEEHEIDSITLGQNNVIRRENFNLCFAGSFTFKGQSFRSAKIKMVKDIGAVICLGLNIPYDKNFLVWCAENYRPNLVDVTIDQIKSRQASIPGTKPSP